MGEVSEDNGDMHHMLEEEHRDELLRQEQQWVEVDVTPTRFLFSKKIVSLAQRQQDGKSKAYKEIPGSSDYERFRARLLYVNNKYTSVQSSWEELFAPVVDKTSVRIVLTTCTLCRRVRLDS